MDVKEEEKKLVFPDFPAGQPMQVSLHSPQLLARSAPGDELCLDTAPRLAIAGGDVRGPAQHALPSVPGDVPDDQDSMGLEVEVFRPQPGRPQLPHPLQQQLMVAQEELIRALCGQETQAPSSRSFPRIWRASSVQLTDFFCSSGLVEPGAVSEYAFAHTHGGPSAQQYRLVEGLWDGHEFPSGDERYGLRMAVLRDIYLYVVWRVLTSSRPVTRDLARDFLRLSAGEDREVVKGCLFFMRDLVGRAGGQRVPGAKAVNRVLQNISGTLEALAAMCLAYEPADALFHSEVSSEKAIPGAYKICGVMHTLASHRGSNWVFNRRDLRARLTMDGCA
mmetsp:Transcript_884/g.2121  ORF Transcript_884/g.2121 Transcript_884/m.2121 type:complete len:334 (-) Transcript_884:86-1087(-)